MLKTASFKRLILRAVLRQVSPMVIRLVSVCDHMPLPEFHDVFRIILGWNGDLGYIIRVHGQEFNSFRRKMRSKALQELVSVCLAKDPEERWQSAGDLARELRWIAGGTGAVSAATAAPTSAPST